MAVVAKPAAAATAILAARRGAGLTMALAAALALSPATPAAEVTGPATLPGTARRGPVLPVGRCINFGNTLEAPREGNWGFPIRTEDLVRVKAGGFATVRLPIRFSGHALTAAPYTIEPALLDRVDQLVRAASALSLNVIIDLHHYDAVMSDPAGERDRFAAIWRQIAERFAKAPASVWFELLNEPKDALTNATLPALWAPALAEIRRTNPVRPVIVGGGMTSQVASLDDLNVPDDPFVVPTFHYYDPLAFTHQGASYLKPVLPTGRNWGSAADRQELEEGVARAARYMARTGRVPFIGEFGAIQGIRHQQRLRYYTQVSQAFAAAGIASCAWSYRNTFQIARRHGWRRGFPEALAAIAP